MKKVLGSLSPAYGISSGHGVFGKIGDSLRNVLPPALIDRARRKRADGKDMTPEEEARGAMKKGGKVKTKKYAKGGSIDGCAIKGKTRGKVC